MEETPEVQVEIPTEKPEIIAEIKNQEDVQHPPQSSKKHTRSSSKFFEVLACLEVNIPLLKHLKDTPTYVKTMKELLLKKKTVKKVNTVVLTKEYSAIIQKNFPTKKKDPVDPASTKPPERSGKTIGNNSQDKESTENFRPSPSQQKEEATISPIPAEEEKKKKEPAAYMPKPPYPQRLKAENKNKAPKKEPKEEKGATNDSVKFQQIQKVPTIPYLPTIMGSNNKTYMITKGVCNKFFEPP
ncbi:hypothetical protein PIB30_062621 [Stylosanthes scabra]|uniref:Uncharacterized protein n=1 Tax=Stylosanthes scabra TaxID=79078 RepID=A0ABU6RLB6_9FABA|nr:hypothetical protein [Stylosanthes scabra]